MNAGGSSPHGGPPGLGRLLARLLRLDVGADGWEGDDWAREFVDALEAEHGRVRERRGPVRARWWAARQLLSLQTWRFVWMMRSRRTRGQVAAHPDTTDGEETTMRHGSGGTWPGRWWRGAMTDLRHAARGLRRDRQLVAFVSLTLALGIGANAALFGIADRLFLRGPDHVRNPSELVRLFLAFDDVGSAGDRLTPWIPWATAEAVRGATTSFTGLGLYRFEEILGELGGQARPLRVATVGEGFFALLGAAPASGRLFGGAGAGDPADVVVLSHELWESAWGGDPGVVGRTVSLGTAPYVVVGVAPPGFTGVDLTPVDLWRPLDPVSAGNRNWQVVGRLPTERATAAGASRAAAEADAVHQRTDPGRFYQWARDGTMVAAPISADEAGEEPAEVAVARFLFAVGGLTLLIGIANVVNLLLARLTRRDREVAVRLALGMGRLRLTRLLLLESLSLAALAGLASLPVAWGLGAVLRRVLLPDVAWAASPLEGRIVAVSAAVALVTGLAVGILPARHANRTDIAGGLASRGSAGSRRRGGVHVGLAGAQIMLSAALLVCAGAFTKSFWTLRVTDLGVDADEVTVMTLEALDPAAVPSSSEEEHRLYRRALEAVAGDPGVARAAVSLGLPFMYNFGQTVVVPGRDSIPALPGGGPWFTAATADYFTAVGTDVVRGRAFTDEEVAAEEPVIVVSESMARVLWPGDDALRACVHVGDAESPCSRVVGVVEDVHRVGYREPPSLQYYLPLSPAAACSAGTCFGGLALVLRLRDGSAGTVERIRATVERVDPVVDHVRVANLESVLEPQVRPWRLGAWVLGLASLLAVLVSVAGVYGVLAYLVERRRREIGVRIALGASRAAVQRVVLRMGLKAAGLGTAAGLASVLAAAPWIRPLLFETSVADPLVLASVTALLLGAALLACFLPARRAAGVDPVSCLSAE